MTASPPSPSGPAADPAGLDWVPAPAVDLDATGRIQGCNTRFCALVGYDSPARLQGSLFAALLRPPSQVYFDVSILPALQRGLEAREVQLLLQSADGQEIPALLFGSELVGTIFRLLVVPIPDHRRLERELAAIRNAMEQVPGAVFQLTQSAQGRLRCIYFAGDAETLLGRPQHRLDLTLWRRLPRDFRHQCARQLADAAGAFALFQCELPLRDAEGAVARWVQVQARAQRPADGQRIWFGHLTDISAQKQTERALAESHELLRVTLDSIGEAVITTDLEGRVRWFNPVAEHMSGVRNEEAHGRPLADVLHFIDEDFGRLDQESVVMACLRDRKPRKDPNDLLLMSRDGNRIYGIEQTAAPIRNSEGTLLGAVLVFHDVTQQRELARELQNRATHDALTGLLNRPEFEHRLAVLLADPDRTRQHALLYIDLDQFKLVNDACGHAAGDILLRDIARVLGAATRNGVAGARDSVARLFGGDEFAILLEDCDPVTAEAIGSRICARMEDHRFVHEGRTFRLGTSIGLVVIDGRWTDVDTLMHAADTACYAAKESGRNRVHAWVENDLLLRRRNGEMQWAARLAEALDEDRLELYGQRIAPLQHPETALHCELLLRLRERDGSVVLPGALIEAAERFHMASQVDRWVLGRALAMLARADHASGRIGLVSINISGQSIADPAFRDHVASLLESTPVGVAHLCFELTETFAVTNLADAQAFVNEVRRLGAKVALDDFGAGASSFRYLKSLHVDFLKIDGGFVRNLLVDDLDAETVNSFQRVARIVGLETVAEFVETEEVREALRVIGVDHVQGYLIHRPEPFAALLERHAGPLAPEQPGMGDQDSQWDLLIS